MSLASFYAPYMDLSGAPLTLDEATSKHCIQVLRMREGDKLRLTDGKGTTADAVIRSADKRSCVVTLTDLHPEARTGPRIYMGISPLKNASRFEWFLEKATEIGVEGIIPLLCERTERTSFRKDRMINILVSAMLQSQQAWLPDLREPVELENVLEDPFWGGSRYIAHCMSGEKKPLRELVRQSPASVLLIGPEGDFTPAEADMALARGWTPVTLGDTRLRTETAGVVAATLLRLG